MMKIEKSQIEEVAGFFARLGVSISPDAAKVLIGSARDGADENGSITRDYGFSTLVEKVKAGEGGNLQHDCIEREYYKRIAKKFDCDV